MSASTTSMDSVRPINESTDRALENTILSPRFYTTDFDEMDRFDISSVKPEWDKLMQEFDQDINQAHFQRPEDMSKDYSHLPDGLYQEFLDFLISSITSEFSGCVLYSEIKKSINNPDLKSLFSYMARDESRHAGFINQWLKDFGIGVDLGFLARTKKYTFFKPKFIFYATYLSEKIGYARYITIYRIIQNKPELRFHPIFLWFEKWCNDEFRHGEAFALLMRSNPNLLSGVNKLWIRFFLLAVYATMYVRDHSRPEFHKALGVSPSDYDRKVLQITSDITKQVFPFTIDLDNPRLWEGFDKLRRISDEVEELKLIGGPLSLIKRGYLAACAMVTFVKIYTMPVVPNELPQDIRLAPVW
ncbi:MULTISPECIES: magnesium-protoporphyrin IX monomethyl ester (oxidative) cyclase [Polynucleobacter]|jgi:magnesium-protoporphyrin IX monomethyl ester (oxidative) cyclase|uniref:Aerobic magnesium-protoporphyrin IX monomethyl ester [oxidative] cyclase n=1 Tax=Polynucleobacter wuianus TaxID=1743168 RepID=A0A191UGR0_9BURK|nr:MULTISPECIES: magnesium-protoporphyrin IX monomethyl ester (oxidative) cyclase [Polynucleobacter]ANJ00102.1 magnesium-protoporphyrin IX monomethyl ester aerobic oxidative cyclase [Polynucleobacter wuianus]MEA9602082.1 magnesium-protoporphyrin IX monomethyl ester (oxidative) cyclase [Polynucleobacter sp. MG-28-Ekke-A2]OJI04152.1 magnesium-protoporphyrin IX monomethyl ester aerobic oxidative cyclase [Polynucleobacter sp. MWH-Adler-W8]